MPQHSNSSRAALLGRSTPNPSLLSSQIQNGRSSPNALQTSLESFASDPAIVSALNENIDLTEYGITLDAKLKEAEGKAVEQYAGEFLGGSKATS